MSLGLNSHSEPSHKNNRERIIQLLINEIVFLGNCYQKAKNQIGRRYIKNAGYKLQKVLVKQQKQKQKNVILPYDEYQKSMMFIYQTIEDVVNKIAKII
ncbi:MAG: hypothetical protein ACFFDO_05165 [Candidatus Thorarchaeota archaeon]